METISTIFQLVIAISALIIIHELGHFLAARIFKIDVEEFGIGYPPRMFTLFERNGTKYSVNWLPFGGFVKLKGETDPDDIGGLMTASPWKRIVVFAAGPMMNFLVGILLYSFLFSNIGAPDITKVAVFAVVPNSPADSAGLQAGDLIIKVNNTPIDSTTTLHNLIYENLGKEISLEYMREENTYTTSLVPRENPPEGEGAIGIVMGNPTQPINFAVAIPMGIAATIDHTYTLVTLPAQVAKGVIAPEEARLVGYKGMYDIYQEIKTEAPPPGIDININVIGFFITITISLAVINLVPIPALDGGRIIFSAIELFTRKRIPPELENTINFVSFVILIGLFLYINLQDFINPIQLP